MSRQYCGEIDGIALVCCRRRKVRNDVIDNAPLRVVIKFLRNLAVAVAVAGGPFIPIDLAITVGGQDDDDRLTVCERSANKMNRACRFEVNEE